MLGTTNTTAFAFIANTCKIVHVYITSLATQFAIKYGLETYMIHTGSIDNKFKIFFDQS